jgi:uncharacterized membrane protein YoaK (UPF0700 family)
LTAIGRGTAAPAGTRQELDRTGPPVRQRGAAWALGLMLALTFSTGVIDAVGYLALDRVFVGNMTGNVVILGMAVTGAEDLPVVGPLLALVAFVVGAVIAGRVLRHSPAAWCGRTSVLLAVVALVIAAVAVALATGVVQAGATGAEAVLVGPLLAVTGALGLAMGVQAATARALAVKDVTTVVVTSTLTSLAADSWLAGGASTAWRRRVGAVALILLGAAAGAALLRVHPAAGLALSALITATAVVCGHLSSGLHRRTAARATPPSHSPDARA